MKKKYEAPEIEVFTTDFGKDIITASRATGSIGGTGTDKGGWT